MTDDKYYEVSETPLKDKSVLGTHGQQLCKNVDVHWTIQTCDDDRNTAGKYEDEPDSRLVPKFVTLNDLERRNDRYLTFFAKFGSFGGQLRQSGQR